MPPCPVRHSRLQMLRSVADDGDAARRTLESLRAAATRGSEAEATLQMLRRAADVAGDERRPPEMTPSPSTSSRPSTRAWHVWQRPPRSTSQTRVAPKSGCVGGEEHLSPLPAKAAPRDDSSGAQPQRLPSRHAVLSDFLSTLVDGALGGIATSLFRVIDCDVPDDSAELAAAAAASSSATSTPQRSSVAKADAAPESRKGSSHPAPSAAGDDALGRRGSVNALALATPETHLQPAPPAGARGSAPPHRRRPRAASGDGARASAGPAPSQDQSGGAPAAPPLPIRVPLSARASVSASSQKLLRSCTPEGRELHGGMQALSARGACPGLSERAASKPAMLLDVCGDAAPRPVVSVDSGIDPGTAAHVAKGRTKAPGFLPRIAGARQAGAATSWRSGMDRRGVQEGYWRSQSIL